MNRFLPFLHRLGPLHAYAGTSLCQHLLKESSKRPKTSYTVRKVWTCLSWGRYQLLTQGHYYQSEAPCTGKKSSKPLKWMVIRVSLMPNPPPSLCTLPSLACAWGDARAVGASQDQPLQDRGDRGLPSAEGGYWPLWPQHTTASTQFLPRHPRTTVAPIN